LRKTVCFRFSETPLSQNTTASSQQRRITERAGRRESCRQKRDLPTLGHGYATTVNSVLAGAFTMGDGFTMA
jgi:hypothetical protein